MSNELEMFQTRTGVRALGDEYEDKVTAYFSLLLAQDPKICDFKISSNDPKYGNFDDLVVQVRYSENDLEQTAAIQLKHQKDGKLVQIESFLGKSGDFSLLKYFKETEEKKIPEEVCLVLFTNRKFDRNKKEKSTDNKNEKSTDNKKNETLKLIIKLEGESKTEYTLEIFQIEEPQPSIIRSINWNTCSKVYQFKPNKIEGKRHEKFEQFLNRLYFFPSQEDVNGIGTKLKEQFLFQPTYEQFVKFIENWNKTETKFKLNKGTIINKFMECLLWPYSVNLCEDISGQEFLFDEVFSKFDVTVFEQLASVIQGYDNKFVDAKKTKISWREEQQFGFEKQTSVIRLLWHLNEIPLIIKSECPKEILRKVLNLPKEEAYGRRLVVVGKVDEEFKDRRILRNLSDFAKDELDEHFKDSQINLQGSKCPLLKYVSNDNELARIFSTDEFVRLLLKEKQIFLGDEQRDLFPYIDRLLQKPIIRWDVLKVKSDSEIFVVSCNGRRGDFTAREQIIVFEETCSVEKFTDICAENEDKNVHHFQITEKINLSWITTKGNIEELTEYLSQIKDEVVVDSEVLNNFTNKVNVLSAEPGMGKSVLLEFLKQNCSKDFWPILINIREYVKTFKENPFDQIVNKIIAKKFKRKDLTAEVVEMMNNRRRILLLWDGLDEAPQGFYEYFLEGVKFISKKGYFQWVASRNHLKNMLEQELHVFALTLKQLDEDNQRFYIKRRLNCNDEREKQIMTHLKNSLHRDLLGTPLQLLILTEIYQNDNNAQNFITLTDMYCKFVEMKFETYNRKINNATENTLLQEEWDYLNKKLLPEYQMFGVLACFEESLVEKLKVTSESHMDFLNKIKEEGDRRGLVVGLLEDDIPLFIHQTYAEYFCALYLKENVSRIGNFLSEVLAINNKYQTIRYMLDILLANGSKSHLDVIYGNIEMLEEWVCSPENEAVEGSLFKDSHSANSLHKIRNTQNRAIKFSNDRSGEMSHGSLPKDLIGRSPLELACIYYHFGAYCIVPQKVKSNMYVVEFNEGEWERNERETKKSENIQAKQFYDIHKLKTLNIFLYCEKVRNLYPLEVLLRLDNSEANKSRIKNLQIFREYFCTFILCCLRNGFESLLSLVKNIPSMEIRVDIILRNNNLLHFIAMYGRSESALTKLLAMTDLDINDRNSFGRTPLIEAISVETPHQGIIKTFIENTADLDAKNFDGETALMTACSRRHVNVAKLLVKKGAAVNSQNYLGDTAILLAAWKGYQDIVNFLLGNGVDLNLKNKDGDSPLVRAIENKFNSSFINKLIEAGANVNAKDEYGCTPLLMLKFYGYAEIANRLILDTGNAVDIDHQNLKLEPLLLRASRKGQTAIVKALIAKRININAKSTRDETSLLLAIGHSQEDIAKLLIQEGADVDAQDEDGNSPLFEAAERGYVDIVNILIGKGANPNVENKEGNTPLILALEYNHTGNEAVVKILLKAGADVNIKNKDDDSPLLLAIEKGFESNIIYEMIEKGDDVNAKDIFGNTPLLMLKFYGPTEIFKKLISKNRNAVDINNRNLRGESLLLRASSRNDLEHVRILTEKEIDVNATGTWGETPLLLAIAFYSHYTTTTIVDYLFRKGADVGVQDVNGNSPLHVAAANGHTDIIQTPPLIYAVNRSWKCDIHVDIVKTLIEAGANINQQNKDGNTPLILALKSTNEYRIDIIKILIEAGANIDVQNKNGDTPLSIAESLTDESIVKILREKWAQ